MALRAFLVLLAFVLTQVLLVESRTWADSPQLTSIWEATKNGNLDHLIEIYSTDKDAIHHRSADGRGPVFWAYEFKQVDILALLMSENVDLAMEDEGGAKPSKFYEGGDVEEFEAQSKEKVSDMGAKLKARIDEKAKAAEDDDEDDEEEEEEAPPADAKPADEAKEL